MKKFLGIVVLSFMLFTPSISQIIELTKCRWTKSGTDELKWSKTWDLFNSQMLKKPKDSKLPFGTYEKYTYSIDLENGIITLLRVYTDEWLIYEKNELNKDFSVSRPKKYETFKYPILSIVDNIIEGKKIFINIENGEVLTGRDTYTCITPLKVIEKSKKKGSILKSILKSIN